MGARRVVVCVLAWALLAGGIVPAAAHPDQHGPTDGHLLGDGGFGDIELVGKLDLTDTPDLVADVALDPRGTFAYLAHWGEPDCAANSEAGGVNSPDAGVWVVDISDLANPKQVGFIPHSQDSRPGEGTQVVHITTRFFNGYMLVTNNEQCGKNGKGGVSLYDVTNPAKPFKLSEHFGDRGFADTHDIHSAFAWDAGDSAYVVIVDNVEFPDVDILDITNPMRPRLIAEYDLNDFDVAQPEIGLTSSFIHDMIVKEIGGKFIMLVSYWDGGYVKLDVTDPANAVFLGDTDFTNPDPELLESTGVALPPEGNGHQAEFTVDNRFFIGTDEDFAPYRLTATIVSGPYTGREFAAAQGTDVPQIDADTSLSGDTVFVGLACNASGPIPTAADTGAEIAVVERGGCTFTEKAANVSAAGYEGGLVFNSVNGSPPCDALVTMSVQGDIPFLFVARSDGLRILGLPEEQAAVCATPAPAVGTLGASVNFEAVFDGWGYVHLFDATTLAELDTYAIDEAHDPAFASGFGDLTVHEVATDPDDWNRAYLSYYSGGIRALEIRCADASDTSTCELVETGGYLDPAGNDFWGVEAFVRDGQTYVLGSDRDSGLWIFRVAD